MRLILILLLFTSCAQFRHDRIVRKYPAVHKVDTVEVVKTVTVEVSGTNGVDTVFYPVFWKDTIIDTIYFENNTKVIIKDWHVDTVQNARTVEIQQPNRAIEHAFIDKQPIIYEPQPLKWWQKWWGISIIILSAVGFGWIMSKFDTNLK